MSAMKNDYVEGSDKADHCDYQNIYHCDYATVDNCDEYQTVGLETGQVTRRTHASVEKEDQNNCPQYIFLVSSVRSSYSHPDQLLIHHHPTFSVTHRSSTLDFHFLSHYSYIGYNAV